MLYSENYFIDFKIVWQSRIYALLYSLGSRAARRGMVLDESRLRALAGQGE